MAVDWTDTIAFAKEMIAEYGRVIQIEKLSAGPADPTPGKRWRGAGVPTVADSVTASGVFLPPSGDEFGAKIATEDMLAEVEQIVLVGQTPSVVTEYNSILDSDNLRYAIKWTWWLKPGNDILLYAFGVCR
jgi:hypothetical protein